MPLPPLTGNGFLDGLEPSDAELLRPILRRTDLKADTILLEQGDVVQDVYLPAGAELDNIIRLEDGTGVLTASVGREGMAGLAAFMADAPCMWQVIVRVAGPAFVASAGQLRPILQATPTLNARMLDLTHFYQVQSAQNVACEARHRVIERLARWLLMSLDNTGQTTLCVTQEELAAIVGVQRTTVVEAAGQLREIGAVKYLRGRIRIVDRALLERQTCECYAALKRLARKSSLLAL